DGNAQIDAGRRGMTGLAPGLPVRREIFPQIGNLGGAQSDEEGQAHRADGRKRLLGVGRHPKRRMRNLVRPRRDRRVLEAVELALVAERLALPRLADDLERLAEARLALAVGDPVDVVGARDAAAADPELDGLVHPAAHLLDEDPEVQGSLRSLTASPWPEQYRSL